MTHSFQYLRHTLVTLLVLGSAATAQGAVIVYDLSNKAPGALNPPDYGLRLDALFEIGDDKWTFDFNENAGSDVSMTIDTVANTVDIAGTVIGGKDVGSVWEAGTVAAWELAFSYDFGVTIDNAATGEFTVSYSVPGDALGFGQNFGYLKLLDAVDLDGDSSLDQDKFIGLSDYHGAHLDLDGGNPDFEGWLMDTDGLQSGDPTSIDLASLAYDRNGACCKDFGANATREVPAPAPLALLGVGLLMLARRVRR